MLRVFVCHGTYEIELPRGESLVGRDLTCRVRFNDASVSRRHLRVRVGADGIEAEDLGSRNGTRLNGRTMRGAARLQDGDVLEIGVPRLGVRLVDGEADGGGLYSDATTHEVKRSPTTTPPPDPEVPLPLPAEHNCPRCRARVPIESPRCPRCRYAWSGGRPAAVTRVMPVWSADRRRAERRRVDVPVIYTSESLTFDATARDLSQSGMFVASELLDPVDTQCRITVLPDGGPAVVFAGVVCRVVEARDHAGQDVPGLGIRFTLMGPEAARWLGAVLRPS